MTRIHALFAAGAVVAAVTVVSIVTVRAEPPRPARPAAASPESLDGFEIGLVPAGLRADRPDGTATYPIEENRLRNDGPVPGTGEPSVSVAMRRYESADIGASRLWITVSRPLRTTAAVDAAQITRWLTGFHTAGTTTVEEYAVPAGRARLIKHVGSEVTAYEVVITAPDGAVITVGGPATTPTADLQDVARHLRPR